MNVSFTIGGNMERPRVEFQKGITIFTQDGSRIGNAYIYDVTDVANRPLYHIETDFGNKTKLFMEELADWFMPGRVCSYDRWKSERLETINGDTK